jgi:hypothetical protein
VGGDSMSNTTLPDRKVGALPHRLRAAIGKGHAAADVPVLVAALEAHGVEVVVRRLQLGDMKGEGFGKY